jgi:hypothetical protein
MKLSVARTLLLLTLIVGTGVAPLAGVMDSCSPMAQAAQAESCGGCCSSMTNPCCGSPAVAGDCACSRPTSPPIDPTQRDRSTHRVELRLVTIGPGADASLDAAHQSVHATDVVASPSWPTIRLQAVLCRWLT